MFIGLLTKVLQDKEIVELQDKVSQLENKLNNIIEALNL
jgi:hypothetical protein